MTTCPDCHGAKVHAAIICGYPMRSEIKCSTCDGAGQISQERMDKIEAGRRMRDARRAQGVSPSERARELGMDVVAYSNLEHGRL